MLEIFFIYRLAMLSYSSAAIILVVLLCMGSRINGELFTALVDLEKVLYAEREVAEDLRSYIGREQLRLNELSR